MSEAVNAALLDNTGNVTVTGYEWKERKKKS